MITCDSNAERLRGFIATPSGAKIPVICCLKRTVKEDKYSHVGQVPIPDAWLDEFERDTRHFYFCGETGEYFTQFHVLDEYDEQTGGVSRAGRLILARDQCQSSQI